MSAPHPATCPSPEAFVAKYGDALAHNFAHDCWKAAESIVAGVREAGSLPAGVDVPRVFQLLLGMRGTLELMAVEHRFGTPTHDAMLAAMDAQYSRNVLREGRYTRWIAAAHETIRSSGDANSWLRLHAQHLLGTGDPDDAFFHAALGYGLRVGASLAVVIAANTEGGANPSADDAPPAVSPAS